MGSRFRALGSTCRVDGFILLGVLVWVLGFRVYTLSGLELGNWDVGFIPFVAEGHMGPPHFVHLRALPGTSQQSTGSFRMNYGLGVTAVGFRGIYSKVQISEGCRYPKLQNVPT